MNGLFRALQPGLMTTVQNLGRPGLQQFGIAPGGAADTTNLRIANSLVRNPATALVLEITLTGPTLEVLSDCIVSIAGADMAVTVDGHPVANYHSVRVTAGSRIAFGRRQSGARAYLAVDGGIAPIDGSLRLKKDNTLYRAADRRTKDRPLIHLAESEVPSFESPAVLRIIQGPHWDRLMSNAQAAFLAEEFTVDLDSNRVGIRLSGPSLDFEDGQFADILSEPTPIGTIQIPSSGHPILLMTDRPITGGYAKVATVISADIPRAAQLAPADKVRFQRISLADAHAFLKHDRRQLRLLEALATWGC